MARMQRFLPIAGYIAFFLGLGVVGIADAVSVMTVGVR